MSEQRSPDPRLDEAMDWLMRLREAPDDPALRTGMETWLSAGPDHRRAWNQARRTWQVMGDVPPATAAAWEAEHPPAPGPAGVAAGRPPDTPRGVGTWRRHRIGLRMAVIAAAACLLLAFGPSLLLHLRADHVTAAEIRALTLADGSIVHLAPESAVDLRFTAERRAVVLLAGEAFFEVTPDARRPFVVEANGLAARALGTAFGVRVSDHAVSVEVASGRVGARSAATTPPIDVRLDGGRTLHVANDTATAVLDRRPPGDMAAWRHGRLLVVDASVAEVVATLRRYRSGWIVIADDRLAARRVNGIYDLHDPDSALQALVHPAGGRVHEITPFLRVLR